MCPFVCVLSSVFSGSGPDILVNSSFREDRSCAGLSVQGSSPNYVRFPYRHLTHGQLVCKSRGVSPSLDEDKNTSRKEKVKDYSGLNIRENCDSSLYSMTPYIPPQLMKLNTSLSTTSMSSAR